MLNITNLEKLIEVPGCSVQVKQVHMTNGAHPQQTYDIVFEHRDRPDREFFITIDREGGQYRDIIAQIDYPVSFWELTGPHNQSTNVTVWETNLQTSESFLGFIDTIIKHYTT
jgi:hypothetical protein